MIIPLEAKSPVPPLGGFNKGGFHLSKSLGQFLVLSWGYPWDFTGFDGVLGFLYISQIGYPPVS